MRLSDPMARVFHGLWCTFDPMVGNGYDQCIVRRFRFFGDLEKSEFFHFSSSPNREAIPHFHTFTNFSFHHQIISFQAREIHRTCKEITSLKVTSLLLVFAWLKLMILGIFGLCS